MFFLILIIPFTYLETNKIKFPAEVDIEWAYFKNASQIQVIEAFSNKGFIYNIEKVIYS